jgi:hypothetical protein
LSFLYLSLLFLSFIFLIFILFHYVSFLFIYFFFDFWLLSTMLTFFFSVFKSSYFFFGILFLLPFGYLCFAVLIICIFFMFLEYYFKIDLLDSWVTLDLTGELWLLLVHLIKFHIKCLAQLELIIQFFLCAPLIFVLNSFLSYFWTKVEIKIENSTLPSVISNCTSVFLTHVDMIRVWFWHVRVFF